MSAWWTEWSTYGPSDFLMFSPRIYWRLFESMNEAWWPAQPMLVAAGLAWMVLRWRRVREHGAMSLRAAAAFLAACWVVVAWAFLLERFAPINWVASGFAVAFAVQGLGLSALALGDGMQGAGGGFRWRAGNALGLWALLGHPLLGVSFGRPWQQAEVFGLAPDPTAIGTLGFLLLVSANATVARRLLRLLWIVPLAWCALSAATLATMGSPQAWALVAAATLAVAAALRR